MPIRFQCDQCSQPLSIARRKVGTEIDCPACGLRQHVPDEPSAEIPVEETIEEAGIEDEALDKVEEAVEEWIEEAGIEGQPLEVDDGDEEGQEPPKIDRSGVEPPPIPNGADLFNTIDLDDPPQLFAGTASPPPPPVRGQGDAEPSETAPKLPIPWSIYAQALLLLTVAVGAFCSGYYLGRQDGEAEKGDPSQGEIAVATEPEDGFVDEEVLLEARLLWMPNFGESSGDEEAVFIALPEDRIPQSSLSIAGLQPGGESSPDSEASIAAIRAAGGEFCWAEVDGTVAAVLPREGPYYLLLISRHVPRSENQPIHAQHLVEMKQYFAKPEALIGSSKYVWERAEIRVGVPVKEHDFGLDGL